MFAETITIARAQAQAVWDHSRLFSDPPAGLLVAVAWESGVDDITSVMVWETPAARGDFAAERMVPLFEKGVLGEEHGHPERVTPVEVYVGAAGADNRVSSWRTRALPDRPRKTLDFMTSSQKSAEAVATTL